MSVGLYFDCRARLQKCDKAFLRSPQPSEFGTSLVDAIVERIFHDVPRRACLKRW